MLHRAWRMLAIASMMTSCVEPEPQPDEDGEHQSESPLAEPSVPEAVIEDPTFDELVRPLELRLWASDERLSASDPLSYSVRNPRDVAVDAVVSVRTFGLGERTSRVELHRLRLEPEQSLADAFALADLPMQAAGGPVEVVIEAALAMPDGTEVVLDSDPLFVAFDQAYATATVAAELDGFEASGELTIRAMATATGRIRGDRGWEPTAAFATSVRPETAVPLPFPDGPTENAQDGYTRFCPKWRVSYDDPNPNQDFLHVSGTQSVPARYASTTVSRNGTVRWSGYLDANGCTPYIYLSSGTYDIALTTALNDANGSTDGSVIVRRSQSDPTIGTAGASVAITQGLSNASYDVNTLVNSRHTRAAALASHFMSIADLRMWRRSLTIYVDQNCAQSAGCASASWIKVGTNYVGTDMTRIRHVVAHEYGHTVQANSFGLMAASYDTVDSPNPMCSCDHVTESNNLHCLQSAETLPAAINEGYAHFIAAIAFNRTATNCSFSYYKSVLIGSLGENEPAIVGPPYAVNCSAAVRWMETNDCVQSHAGTEWDWLTFLWDLRVGEFNGFGMTDIYWMFRLSCDPDHSDWGNPCGVGDLYWSELATQMNAWTSLYRDEFFRAANAHGVDH